MQDTRSEELKTYLKRLNDGEDLDQVRADFAAAFKDVSAEEIMDAEQSLIEDGVPAGELSNLCDIHSALFQGKTCRAEAQTPAVFLAGHPINVLTRENREIGKRLDSLEKALNDQDHKKVTDGLQDLLEASRHYDKKDQLLLPVLKRAGVPGPSDVMWDVDGQIRKRLTLLAKQAAKGNIDAEGIRALTQRMREMIRKEAEILYPMAEKKLTKAQWQEAAKDMPKFGYSYLTDVPSWGDPAVPEAPSVELLDEAHLHLPGGELTLRELAGILKALPVELTFIDKNNIARYFSEDGTLFPRPTAELGHDVFDCHPPKARPIVETLLASLRAGEKNVVSFVADKHGRKAYIRYLAVRDQDGAYLGTLEAVEDITEIPTI